VDGQTVITLRPEINSEHHPLGAERPMGRVSSVADDGGILLPPTLGIHLDKPGVARQPIASAVVRRLGDRRLG
jgi:hypothetical protein